MNPLAPESEPKTPKVDTSNPNDRSALARLWYNLVQAVTAVYLVATGGFRANGRHHLPKTGAALLVSNHVSFLDVFVLGIPLHRPLNYVARSTLFLPGLGALIRSVGGFPIQRDGMGASGLKETLRRLKRGGIVILFPEGTRSADNRLGELKPGIASLAAKAKVPVIPAAVAGTFEAWPKSQLIPLPHALRIVYGPAIEPSELKGLSTDQITALIRERILDCQTLALEGLRRDVGGCHEGY